MGKKIAYFFIIIFIVLVAAAVYIINPLENKITSGLQVLTTDVPASLFLDEQFIDITPYINKKIQPGRYRLQIIPEDTSLSAYETPITLRKGLLTVVVWKPGPTTETSGGIIYELEPLPNKNQTEIFFNTIPNNAIIQFDDQDQIFAPKLLKDVEPGRHEFEVSLPSYESQQNTLQAVAGHRLNITVQLAKEELSEELELELADEPAEEATEEVSSDESALLEDSDSEIIIQPTNYFLQGKEVLRVRAGAGTDADPVGFAEVGESYPMLDSEDGWYQINFTDALDGEVKEGWVSGEFADAAADENSENDEAQN